MELLYEDGAAGVELGMTEGRTEGGALGVELGVTEGLAECTPSGRVAGVGVELGVTP